MLTLGQDDRPKPNVYSRILLRCDRDDPALGRAGTIFGHGLDARSPKPQSRSLAPVLGKARTSRFEWISRLNCLHGITKGRSTRKSSVTRSQHIRETLSNDSRSGMPMAAGFAMGFAAGVLEHGRKKLMLQMRDVL